MHNNISTGISLAQACIILHQFTVMHNKCSIPTLSMYYILYMYNKDSRFISIPRVAFIYIYIPNFCCATCFMFFWFIFVLVVYVYLILHTCWQTLCIKRYCTPCTFYRRRINTEERAKVVTAVWGIEFINFLAFSSVYILLL